MTVPFVLAMAAPPQGGANPFGFLITMGLVALIFWVIVGLPMQRRQKKVAEFLGSLKVGDQVVTSGGIYGTITRIGEHALQLQIADRVRVDISRNAVVGYQGQEPVAPTGDGSTS